MTMEDLTRLSNSVQFSNWRHIQAMLYSVNKTHQSWLQFRHRWSWSYLCSEGYDGNKYDNVLVKFSLLIWSVVRFYHKSKRTRNDFTLNAASPVQFWHEAAGHSNVVFKKGTKKQTENWKNFLSVIRLSHAKINTIQNSMNITDLWPGFHMNKKFPVSKETCVMWLKTEWLSVTLYDHAWP